MLKLLVVCACLTVALAAVALAPLEKKPDEFMNEEGCYISDLNRVIPEGERAPSTSQCMSYLCQSDSVQWLGCGVLAVPDGCREVRDEAPHPDCCPRIEC